MRGCVRVVLLVVGVFNMNVDISDVGFDLILLGGQSNCQGWSTGKDDEIDYTHPDILQYPSTYPHTLMVASEPLRHVTKQPDNQIGFPLTFARLYLQTIPKNRRCVLVPTALGGSAIKDWLEGGNLFENAVTRCNEMITNYRNTRLVAVLWHQGEADAGGKMPGSEYAVKLDSMIAGFRNRIIGASEKIPFFVGGLVVNYALGSDGNSNGKTGSEIQTAIVAAPERNLNTFFVSAEGLKAQSDRTHFRASDMRKLGERYFYKYLDYLRSGSYSNKSNSFANPTPPQFSIAKTSTEITLSWEPDLNTKSWEIRYKEDGEEYTEILLDDSSISSYKLSGLTPDTAYAVELYAVGNSDKSIALKEVTTDA